MRFNPVASFSIATLILSVFFVSPHAFSQPEGVPPDVLELLLKGYVYADYPGVFDEIEGDGLTFEAWIHMTEHPKERLNGLVPDGQWPIFAKPGSYCGTINARTLTGGLDRQHITPNRAKGPIAFRESPLLIGGIKHLPFENKTEWFGPEHFESLKGYIDECRISKGLRYTEVGSIRPKRRFQADAGTIALWHFDEGRFALRYADASGMAIRSLRAVPLPVMLLIHAENWLSPGVA